MTATQIGFLAEVKYDPDTMALSNTTTLELPTLHDVALPDDHPVNAIAIAPNGDGPNDWPGFDAFCGQVIEAKREQVIAGMTPQEIAAIWNRTFEADGGTQIRWDAALGEFISTNADPFSFEDVCATVKGLIK